MRSLRYLNGGTLSPFPSDAEQLPIGSMQLSLAGKLNLSYFPPKCIVTPAIAVSGKPAVP
jgi:hypothetical protein